MTPLHGCRWCWSTQWISGAPRGQLVDLLIKKGSVWLRKIKPEDRRHTFTLITYGEKTKPHVYVISNYEYPGQPPEPTGADELFCTPIRPRSPRCIVTGWAPAVSEEQRAGLTSLLAHVPLPDQLRDAVALTNREASAKAEDTVSKECIVVPGWVGADHGIREPSQRISAERRSFEDESFRLRRPEATRPNGSNARCRVLAGQKTNPESGRRCDGAVIPANFGLQVA